MATAYATSWPDADSKRTPRPFITMNLTPAHSPFRMRTGLERRAPRPILPAGRWSWWTRTIVFPAAAHSPVRARRKCRFPPGARRASNGLRPARRIRPGLSAMLFCAKRMKAGRLSPSPFRPPLSTPIRRRRKLMFATKFNCSQRTARARSRSRPRSRAFPAAPATCIRRLCVRMDSLFAFRMKRRHRSRKNVWTPDGRCVTIRTRIRRRCGAAFRRGTRKAGRLRSAGCWGRRKFHARICSATIWTFRKTTGRIRGLLSTAAKTARRIRII